MRKAAKICIAALILALLLCAVSGTASAANKEQKSRTIAVVFDNSGSMYLNGNYGWCRATYAIEVFASMMNSGDTMLIYPMNEIEVDGERYSMDKPLTISGPEQAGKVRNIFTINAQGTPIETIRKAADGLNRQTNTEKWLVVLTDGDTFDENGKAYSNGETPKKVGELLDANTNNMNILYLGIGKKVEKPTHEVSGQYQYYADIAAESTAVLEKLTYMGNMIFGRDAMKTSGNTISFDVSLSKLIVFVQGQNVSNVTLTGDEGVVPGSVVETKYSERGAERKGETLKCNVDTNLQGVLATYENCKSGTYRLDYSGAASSTAVYYEPNVDLVVQLIDSEGNVIDRNSTAYAGSYTLAYGLIDNQTGELTQSELLGNTHYDVVYSVNGQETTLSSDNKFDSTEIELNAGDVIDATISAEYLNGYHITKSSSEFGWPDGGFAVSTRPINTEALTLVFSGGQSEYKLSELEEAGVYRAKVYYENEQLTGEAFGRTNLTFALDGGNLQYTLEKVGDEYEVRLKYAGDAHDTDCGAYTISAAVEYVNEDGQRGVSAESSIPFTVEDDQFGLSAQIELQQSYYVLSDMEQAKPVIVHITKDGAPLTAEEMALTSLSADTDGLKNEITMLPEESAYAIRLLPSEGVETGKHPIRADVSMPDPFGQTLSAQAEDTVEVEKYPLWMRWAVIGLIALILLALLLLFLNQKVLPKKVLPAGQAELNVGGRNYEDNARIKYDRSGKRLSALAPPAPAGVTFISCDVAMRIMPESPRRISSKNRKIRVMEVRADQSISSIEIGAATYTKDEMGHFVKDDGSSETVISNGSVITVNGTAQTDRGQNRTAIFTQQLRFK